MLVLTAIVVVSCSSTKTMGEQYPAMYEEKPVTIAIMPPINQTTHAEAKDYFTRQCTFLYVRKDTMSFLRI